MQEQYIRREELPSNYNIVRWNKKVTEILLNHCVGVVELMAYQSHNSQGHLLPTQNGVTLGHFRQT